VVLDENLTKKLFKLHKKFKLFCVSKNNGFFFWKIAFLLTKRRRHCLIGLKVTFFRKLRVAWNTQVPHLVTVTEISEL
jgi:hypothetical protein